MVGRAGSEPLDGHRDERDGDADGGGWGVSLAASASSGTTGTGGASCLRRVGRMLELDDAPYRMLTVRFNLA